MTQDLRFAIRTLLKSPGFTIVAVATLGLGIGATTAVFSIVNAVLLRPISYPSPDRSVTLQEASKSGTPSNTSYATYMDWKARNGSFQNVATFKGRFPRLTGEAGPEKIAGLAVTHEFFDVLGAPPLIGRDFRADDDRLLFTGPSLIASRSDDRPGARVERKR